MNRWDDTNIATAFLPINRRGRNAIYSSASARRAFRRRQDGLPGEPQIDFPEESGAGSGNFSLSVPVIRLPGRGLALALDLHYNSQVWHRAGNQVIFDIDEGWPAPGWSLGFGYMEPVYKNQDGSVHGYMLVDADGTRHPFTRSFTSIQGVEYYGGRTTDGSFIDYAYERNMTSHPPTFRRARANYPDGTVVEYGAGIMTFGHGRVFPTRITDANGNYITITYRNNKGSHPDTITDTLGRTITFHYDSNNVLTAITAPGVGGGTRTLVRLVSNQRKLDYAFDPSLTPIGPNPEVPNDKWVRLLEVIYYPGTQTGYGLYHSKYGMVTTVDERRGMSFSGSSLNEQGTVVWGTLSRRRDYNYPGEPDATLKDAPKYTTLTETWDGMDTPPAVTSYIVQQAQALLQAFSVTLKPPSPYQQ
jgi:hypothetical protein